jgi:hypothetical protein
MALTTDNLTTVEGLTPEQTAAIIALSEKDSELVAKKAAGEATSTAYGLVDEALKAVTGKEKPGGVFTTDHLKSTLSQLKSASESGNAKTLKAELDDVKAKYEALQKEKASPRRRCPHHRARAGFKRRHGQAGKPARQVHRRPRSVEDEERRSVEGKREYPCRCRH